jgi:hypothetical protein
MRKALRTSDYREAVKGVRKRSVAIDELYEAHRRKLALKAAGLTAVSPHDIDLQAFHEQERMRVDEEPPQGVGN